MNEFKQTVTRFTPILILSAFLGLARGQEVSIPDPGLNAAIRAALQKPIGPLTTQDLLGLTNLSAGGRDISNIAGLEAARNLRFLDLDSNSITNFNLPAVLTGLTQLDLSANELSSLTLPPEVTNLASLSLEGNPLTTLVLPEPLATTILANTVAILENQGVSVFAYPLAPKIVRLLPLSGAFKFGITGPPGVYAVLGSTDLAAWIQVGTATNTLGAVNFIDVTSHLYLQRFYRLVLQVAPAN